MKPLLTLAGIYLFLLPCLAWAQSSSPEPLLAGQSFPDRPMPPPRVLIQKRIGPGGQEEGIVSLPLGGPLFAGGLGAWWKNSEIVSKLQLSEDQVKKIEQTYLDHKLKLIDLQADLEKNELRLQPLLDADHPDQGKVGTQIDLITTVRGKLEKENAMMMLAIRSQLTVEQWKKLKSLQSVEELGKRNVFYLNRGMGPDGEGGVEVVPGPFPPMPPGDGPVILPAPRP